MSDRDKLFSSSIPNLGNWKFDKQVAEVFQDMVQRSIPGYLDIVSMISILAKSFVQPETHIYDLGCSLGTVTLSVCQSVHQQNCKIIAVDNSSAMIEYFKRYINNMHKIKILIDIVECDIRNIDIKNASMVILNFTLQFLPPSDRQELLNRIYSGLNHGGALILSEKFAFNDTKINKLLLNMHHNFKRHNGYSELEINQKFNMLENSMLIDSIETHKIRLHKAGFNKSELWFQYLNFGSLLALKD